MSNTSLMPTRRTVIRTAAWTAPAVSLAVTSPAFASSGTAVTGTATTLGSTRSGSTLNLKSSLKADSQPISGLTATVTLSSGSISTISTPAGWTRTGLTGSTATYTYTGTLSSSGTATFEPVVTLATDPGATSVTSTIAFAWQGGGPGASVTVVLAGPAASLTAGTAIRTTDPLDKNVKGIQWNFSLSNTGGSTALANLTLDFDLPSDVSKPVSSFTVTPSGASAWSVTAGRPAFTASWGGAAPTGGQTLNIQANFVSGDNAPGDITVRVYSGTVLLGTTTVRYQ